MIQITPNCQTDILTIKNIFKKHQKAESLQIPPFGLTLLYYVNFFDIKINF